MTRLRKLVKKMITTLYYMNLAAWCGEFWTLEIWIEVAFMMTIKRQIEDTYSLLHL